MVFRKFLNIGLSLGLLAGTMAGLSACEKPYTRTSEAFPVIENMPEGYFRDGQYYETVTLPGRPVMRDGNSIFARFYASLDEMQREWDEQIKAGNPSYRGDDADDKYVTYENTYAYVRKSCEEQGYHRDCGMSPSGTGATYGRSVQRYSLDSAIGTGTQDIPSASVPRYAYNGGSSTTMDIPAVHQSAAGASPLRAETTLMNAAAQDLIRNLAQKTNLPPQQIYLADANPARPNVGIMRESLRQAMAQSGIPLATNPQQAPYALSYSIEPLDSSSGRAVLAVMLSKQDQVIAESKGVYTYSLDFIGSAPSTPALSAEPGQPVSLMR